MPTKDSQNHPNCPELDDIELIRIQLEHGRLVDRYGHEHSEAIFLNWSPKALRALGVRRVDDDGDADA